MTTESFSDNLSVSDVSYDGERPVAFPHEAAALLHEAHPQQLAQAGTQAGADALPAAQPGVEVVAAADNVVKLPAGTSIEKIEIDGDNLILIQPDGTRIVIEHAALHVPTFVIDDVEIPQEALVAALEASNINVAAGPDGTLTASASGSQSAGGNFSETASDIGEANTAIDLLAGTTGLQIATLGDDEQIADVDSIPTLDVLRIAGDDGVVWESALPGGTGGGDLSASGTMRIDTGTDALAYIEVQDKDGNWVRISSNGTIVHGAYGDLSVNMDGAWTYTLSKNTIAHSGIDKVGAADQVQDSFSVRATDDDGDTTDGSAKIVVQINDDGPSASEGTGGTVEDEAVHGGNDESDGYSASVGSSLNIAWGADANNDGGPNSRSVAFKNADVAVTDGNGATLTSLGLEVHTAILPDGTLVGYTGDTAPTAANAGDVVFYATVSGANNGEYVFTLVKPLDHAAGDDENTLSLTFNYTATDADGDTSSNTFTVKVADDVATIGTPVSGLYVEEEELSGGNEDTSGTGDADVSFSLYPFHLPANNTTASAKGDLAISWGADDKDDDSAGATIDRSVQFTDASVDALEARNLTSNGDAIQYTVVTGANGQQTLVAYTGTDHTVFTVTLSDNGSGSYTFRLHDTLDNAAGNGANGEDTLSLEFGFTATDSDGDVTVPSSFTVNVIDDVPTADGASVRYVEEEALSGGNEDASPLGVEVAGVLSNGGLITDRIGASLNIHWGADDGNKAVDGGYTGSQAAGDRSVVFATGNGTTDTEISAGAAGAFLTVRSGSTVVNLADLTSDGQHLTYTLSADGTRLTATADGKTIFTVTLSDTDHGSYSFDLDGAIDHPVKASGASNEDVLSFHFTATARDGDGDVVTAGFTVNVIDDAPVRGTEAVATVEDESASVHGNQESDDGYSASVSNVSLGLKWGADNGDSRSVAFTNPQVTASGAHGAALTSLGAEVHTTILSDGTLVGYTGGTVPTAANADSVVFYASVSDAGSGAYAFTLVKPLDHAAGHGEDTLSLTFGYTAKDSDGDSVTGSFTVKVADDVPVSMGDVTASTVLDDDAQTVFAGNTGGNDDVENATSVTGDAGALFTVGADGIKSVTLSAGQTFTVIYKDTDGSTHQETATWSPTGTMVDGSTTFTATSAHYTGVAGSSAAATLVINADGSYTFTLNAPVVQATAGTTEEDTTIKVGFTVTDGDDDTATGSLSVNVNDDTPTATLGKLVTQESAKADGTFNEQAWNGRFAFSAGADGGQVTAVHYDLGTKIADGDAQSYTTVNLTSNGKQVTVTESPDHLTLTGKDSDGATVFVLKVTNPLTGDYTYTQSAPLDHPDIDESGTQDVLRMRISFTVTDGDGDTVTNHIQLDIKDDAPSFATADSGFVAEDASDKSTSGSLGILWGADSGAARTLVLKDGGSDVLVKDQSGATVSNLKSEGRDVHFALVGAVLVGYVGSDANDAANQVFTVAVDAATGKFTFVLLQPLDHTSPSLVEATLEQSLTFTFTAVAKDADGDSATGHFDVTVDAAGSLGSIDYGNLASGVFVNLSGSEFTWGGQTVAADTATDMTGSHVVGNDAMAGIVDAYGSQAGDVLVGGDEANHLKGDAGHDVLIGNGGDDTLEGGGGDDALYGGSGSDMLIGGEGNDTAYLGRDVTVSNGATRTVLLGDGTQISVDISGKAGTADHFDGGAGYDVIKLDQDSGTSGYVYDAAYAPGYLSGVEEIDGTDGADVILVSSTYLSDATDGGITLVGGKGDDVLQGGAGNDTLLGGDDDDLLSGLGGDDHLEGGNGNDTIYGGDGNDTLSGGNGADELHGGAGDDQINGDWGSDTIYGDAGNDRIYGGGDDDIISGGAGNDIINGGDGKDTAVYDDARSNYTIGDTRDAGTGWVTTFNSVTETVVTGTDEGTDTLTSIEVLQFGNVTLDLTQDVQLFDAGHNLVGTFDHIQEAIAASSGIAGAVTVLVKAGSYDENITINRDGVTLLSAGAVTINGVAGGVAVTVAAGVKHVTIGSETQGFTINAAENQPATEIKGNNTNVTVEGNTITANGDSALRVGNVVTSGLTIDHNTFAGATYTMAETAAASVALVSIGDGATQGDRKVTVNFHHNTVSGDAGKSDLVSISAHDSNVAQNMVDGTTEGGAGITAIGPRINFAENTVDNRVNDSTSTGFNVDNEGTTPNYNANKVFGSDALEHLNGTPGGDTITGGEDNDIIDGGAGNDNIKGDAGNDTITGGKGNDTINGGEGNDTIKYTTGDGADTIDGGADTDTLIVTGDAADNTFTISNVGDPAKLDLTVDGTTSTVIRVEEIEIDGGEGDDTLNVVGNLDDTGLAYSTIHFNGGAGNDTLDISGLTSTHDVVADGGSDTAGDTVKLNFAYAASGDTYAKIVDDTGKLIGVTITHVNGNNTTTTDSFTNFESFTFSDGTVKTLEKVFAPVVAAAGGAVYVEPDGDDLHGTNVLKDITVNVADVDSREFSKVTVAITNAQTGDELNMPAAAEVNGVQIDYTVETTTVGDQTVYTMTFTNHQAGGTLTADDISDAIQTLVLFKTNNALSSTTPDRTIDITVYDESDTASHVASVTLDVQGTNDTPTWTNTAPAASVNEDLSFSLDTVVISTSLKVSDLDADGDAKLTLSVAHGTLSISQAQAVHFGVTFAAGENGTGSVTLTGTMDHLNKLLVSANGVTYTPVANYSGADELTLRFSDNGDLGLGAKTSETTIAITVDAVADAPALTVSNGSGDEDTVIAIPVSAALTDADSSESLQTVISDIPVGAVLSDGANTFTATAGGTSHDVSSWNLASLTIKPPLDSDADFTLKVTSTATEGSNHDTESTVKTVNVVVNPVDDGDAMISLTDSTPSTGPTVGDTLTASMTADPDGGNGSTVTYTWYRGGEVIGGATNATYQLVSADAGKTIKVSASYVDGQGFHETVTSAATAAVLSGNHVPTAVGETILTNASSVVIPDWVLLMNDSDADSGDTLSVHANPTSATPFWGSLTDDGVTTTYNGAWPSGGSFKYTVSDDHGGTSSEAKASVEYTPWSVISTGNGGSIVIAGDGNDLIDGGNGKDILLGGAGNDTIDGGTGKDILYGGVGADTLTGGNGADTFKFDKGDTSLTVEDGSRWSIFSFGRVSGYDTITDFKSSEDKLELAVSPEVAVNTGGKVDGNNAAVYIGFNNELSVSYHSITNGIITFYSTQNGSAINVDSGEKLAAVVKYLQNNDLGASGTTVAFHADFLGSSKDDTFIYQQVGDIPSAQDDILIALRDADISNLNTLFNNGTIDPIVLDLDGNGFAFTSLDDGVSFDINADGSADKVAWTSTDGILAYDVNGNGTIDDGSEVFTPDFAGGKFASGAAALASLDSNGDGILDADDEAFSKLLIWQDTNHDGVGEAGELTHLSDHGITGLDTATTAPSVTSIDGQTVAGEGTVHYADGSKGTYIEVHLDTLLGADGADNDAAGMSGAGETAETFVIDPSALVAGDHMAEILTGYNTEKGDVVDLTELLGNKVSADHIGDFVRTVEGGDGAADQLQVSATGHVSDFVTVAVLDANAGVKVLYNDDQHHQQNATV